jgi:hypothetical protein
MFLIEGLVHAAYNGGCWVLDLDFHWITLDSVQEEDVPTYTIKTLNGQSDDCTLLTLVKDMM